MRAARRTCCSPLLVRRRPAATGRHRLRRPTPHRLAAGPSAAEARSEEPTVVSQRAPGHHCQRRHPRHPRTTLRVSPCPGRSALMLGLRRNRRRWRRPPSLAFSRRVTTGACALGAVRGPGGWRRLLADAVSSPRAACWRPSHSSCWPPTCALRRGATDSCCGALRLEGGRGCPFPPHSLALGRSTRPTGTSCSAPPRSSAAPAARSSRTAAAKGAKLMRTPRLGPPRTSTTAAPPHRLWPHTWRSRATG